MRVDVPPLALTGIGLSTSLGPDLATTRAAMAKGRPRLLRLRSFLGSDFAPQISALSAEPEPGDRAAARMAQLASAALVDFMASRQFSRDARGLILAILLPEAGPHEALTERSLTELADAMAADVSLRIGFAPEAVSVHPGGNAALAEALHHHAPALSQGIPI